MNNLLIEAIDSVIEESQNPIILEHSSNTAKIKTYLRDKYVPLAIDLSEARPCDLFITEFYDHKNYPRWYVNMCTLCIQNSNEKNILIIDSLEEVDANITSQLLTEIVMDEQNNYPLPENATIIIASNGKISKEQKQLLEEYNDYLTFVNSDDSEDIYITFGADKKGKTK